MTKYINSLGLVASGYFFCFFGFQDFVNVKSLVPSPSIAHRKACIPPFKLASPLGFQSNPAPKGNLTMHYTCVLVERNDKRSILGVLYIDLLDFFVGVDGIFHGSGRIFFRSFPCKR